MGAFRFALRTSVVRKSPVAWLSFWSLGNYAFMQKSKRERYRRLSWLAGMAVSVCAIFWIALALAAQFMKRSTEDSYDWIGICCGILALITMVCCATCLTAGIVSCFQSENPSQLPNTSLEPTAVTPVSPPSRTESPVGGGSVLGR
jgi:hypothetical protein